MGKYVEAGRAWIAVSHRQHLFQDENGQSLGGRTWKAAGHERIPAAWRPSSARARGPRIPWGDGRRDRLPCHRG